MPIRNKRFFKNHLLRASMTLFAGLWMLVACTPDDNAYSDFKTMADAEWLYTDSLEFAPVNTADSTVCGSLLVAVRHTHGYRYRNIWLEVSYPAAGIGAESTAIVRDTVNVELADSRGHWLGKGSGASFMREDTALRRFTLRRGVPVRVRHVMRLDTLHDIEQVGVIFVPD